jgi:hypothetical protein
VNDSECDGTTTESVGAETTVELATELGADVAEIEGLLGIGADDDNNEVDAARTVDTGAEIIALAVAVGSRLSLGLFEMEEISEIAEGAEVEEMPTDEGRRLATLVGVVFGGTDSLSSAK